MTARKLGARDIVAACEAARDARVDAIAAAARAFGARYVMDYRETYAPPTASIRLGRGLRGDIYGRGRSIEGARRSLLTILDGLGEGGAR